MDRLRQIVAEAAKHVPPLPSRPAGRMPGPLPGDLFVLGAADDASVEWLVVRAHPDDSTLVLVAPADDFPLAGFCDVTVPADLIDRPFTVRSGEAAWIPARACPDHAWVGTVPDNVVRLVRHQLAAMARGNASPTDVSPDIDADPDYSAWLGLVGRTRERLQVRADNVAATAGSVIPSSRFLSTLPAGFSADRPLALAASPGGLASVLGAALEASGPRYLELPAPSGGQFLLTADSAGVRFSWAGQPGIAPPPLTAIGPDGPLDATWQPGVDSGRYHSAGVMPWVDGQVAFTVAGDLSQSWTIRL